MKIESQSGISVLLWIIFILSSANAISAADRDLRLVDAVRNGDTARINSLLQDKVDVNAAQPDGATPLLWAVHRDDVETARLLISAGADVNAANDYGVTPLSQGCTNRNITVIEKLLKAGAKPNASMWTGETVLMTCVMTGNLKAVQLLLDHGADVNTSETRRGQTALMWAIAEGYPEIAQVLIASGADVQARSHMLAVEFSPMIYDTYGDDVLVSSQGEFTPLLFAAQQGDIDTAKLLLAKGANVNEVCPDDGTPLLVATANGHEDFALFLLENGADPNVTDANGITPLHYALRSGMKMLFGLGDDLEAENERSNEGEAADVASGLAAGGVAVKQGKDTKATSTVNQLLLKSSTQREPSPILRGFTMKRLIRALLAHGADTNARVVQPPRRLRANHSRPQVSFPGATPLLLASSAGETEIMLALIERGAKPEIGTAVDEEEMAREEYSDNSQFQGTATPLLVAAGLGRNRERSPGSEKRALEAVRMLVDLGADVNEPNEVGWTPLHSAAWTGADSIVQFLVDHGAKLDVQNGCGQTPMSLAAGASPLGLRVKRRPRESTVEILNKLGVGATKPIGPVGHCIPGRVPALADLFGL